MRLIQGIGKRAWKMDCCIWQKTRGLYFPWPRRRASSSDDGPANEPSAEILGCRGGARSQEVRKRIFTTDEGSPHLEWHRRYRGSPGAVGPHEDRVNGESPLPLRIISLALPRPIYPRTSGNTTTAPIA